MNNVFLWAQALQISDESLASWRKDVPSDSSLIFWALSNGKVPVGSYLYWAQVQYGLPVLTENFLISDMGLNTWKKFKGMNVWSMELLPIAEWDGVVFVAAPEPIKDLKWSIPVQFVLADPNMMIKLWNQYNTPAKTPEKMESITEPPPVHISVPTSAESDEATVFKRKVPVENTSMSPELSPPPIDPAAPLDAPDGFALSNLPPPPPGMSSDSLFDELAKYQGPTNTETSNATSAPEGFSADALKIPSMAEVGAELPSIEDQSIHTQTHDNLTATVAIPSQPNTDPRFSTSETTKNRPTNDGTTNVTNITAQNNVNAHIGVQLPFILANYRDAFAGAFVFLVEGESLKNIAWTEVFAPATPEIEQKPISLTGPSAFRVAVRTKNPYFGHVVETQINRQFFQSWGHPTLPPQIVVQPNTNSKNDIVLVLLIPNPLLTNGTLILEKAKNFSFAIVAEMEKINSNKSAA